MIARRNTAVKDNPRCPLLFPFPFACATGLVGEVSICVAPFFSEMRGFASVEGGGGGVAAVVVVRRCRKMNVDKAFGKGPLRREACRSGRGRCRGGQEACR